MSRRICCPGPVVSVDEVADRVSAPDCSGRVKRGCRVYLTLRVIRIAALLCAALWWTASAGAQDSQPLAPTTVILVRHAEKSVPLGDYPLNRQGFARARELARVLGDSPIVAIYATQYMRTQQTVAPLAERLKLQVTSLQTTEHYVTDVVDRIRVDHVGQTVVIVSHRNTVPAIIEALGASPVPEITEEQYDRLYMVTIAPGGGSNMMSLRYGRNTR